jgi:flagellar protein FlaF
MSAYGYAKQQNLAMESGNPQQTLAWGLTTTARKLAAVQSPGTPKEAFLDAVRLNWRLWTIIQAEQADPECKTTREVRESMLSLANFIDKHSIDILAGPSPDKLDVLISINRNIAAGLLGTDLTPEQRAEREQQARTGAVSSA